MDSIFNHPEVLTVLVALPLFGILAKLFGATFQRIARWYLYVAVFAVVVVMNSMFFPFIGGKDYFFRVAVELSLIFFAFAWAFEMKAGELKDMLRSVFKKPLVKAVTVFTGMFLLACLFAYDIHAAFWSNYERGEGGFQMIHYYLFFMLLLLLLRTEKEWKNLFKFSLISAGLMLLYGIGGDFVLAGFIGPYTGGAVPTGWWSLLTVGRFQGSLGNPAYVAPYLMFAMFYAVYLWINHAKESKEKGSSRRWLIHAGYALLVVIFLVFFVLSQTRGAFVGLGVGAFAFLLYFAIAGRGTWRKWSLAGVILVLVAGGAVFALRNSSFIENQTGVGRLLQLSTSDATAQTRFWVWGEAWKGFLERPVLGWGPENFTAVFDKFFNPNFYVPGQNNETWFDRAHSVYFDYLSETGILGLLSYLAVFAVFVWEFFKRHRHEDKTVSAVAIRGFMLALPIAYLVQGAAIFDVLPMYINLFLFMAFASYFFYEKHGQNR